jgi:hypothetical protein
MRSNFNSTVESSYGLEHLIASNIYTPTSVLEKEYPQTLKNCTVHFFLQTSLCTSDELIQFDPPQLPFTFLPNKRVSMLRKFKVINVTHHIVGFSIGVRKGNLALYYMEPNAGILPPQSTQEIKVRRTLKKNETEDVHCKDKILVWNGIVTEGIEVSDVAIYCKEGGKELPVILTMVSSLICQFYVSI